MCDCKDKYKKQIDKLLSFYKKEFYKTYCDAITKGSGFFYVKDGTVKYIKHEEFYKYLNYKR